MGRGIKKRKVMLMIELAPNTYPIAKLRKKGEVEVYVRLYGLTYDRLKIEQIQANVIKDRQANDIKVRKEGREGEKVVKRRGKESLFKEGDEV